MVELDSCPAKDGTYAIKANLFVNPKPDSNHKANLFVNLIPNSNDVRTTTYAKRLV